MFSCNHKVEYHKSITLVNQQLNEVFILSEKINGRFWGGNKFIIESTEKYSPFLSTIEKPFFTINGHLSHRGNKTLVNYRIRGNSTISILIIPVLFSIIPTIYFGLQEQSSSTMSILIVLLTVLAIMFLSMSSRKNLRKGKSEMKKILDFLDKN